MEFNEKLQELRKEKGLTQEALAERLYVSRTAVSKWESGRGFPNIDSLKAISKLFSVSVDELLSGEAILALAEKDSREKSQNVRDLVFGLLDCGMGLLFLLPFFGQRVDGGIQSVDLLALHGVQTYLRTVYIISVCAMMALGVATLALQNCRKRPWTQSKHILSLVLSILAACLFVISQQPYAAVFTLAFLAIKAIMLMKRG